MASRSSLLLLVVVALACGAVVWLLRGNGARHGGVHDSPRPDGPIGGPGDLIDAEGVGLHGRSGARSAEEIAAERATREAAAAALPTFPRSEGVFGRVTDASNRPLAGATVKLILGQLRLEGVGRARSAAPRDDGDGRHGGVPRRSRAGGPVARPCGGGGLRARTCRT